MSEEQKTTLNGRLNLLQSRINELERQLTAQEATVRALQQRLAHLQATLCRLAEGAAPPPAAGEGVRNGTGGAKSNGTYPSPEVLTSAELVSCLAHELNQPLTAIATYGRACLRLLDAGKADGGEVAAALEQIAVNAEHAGRFLGHVRGQLRSGKALRIPVQLNAQIRDVAGHLEQRILLEQARLQLHLADELPAVLGDPVQLEQVLLNLLQNALEAMHQTPPDQRVLTIRSSREEGEVTVAVSDTGSGVTEDMARRMFQPFQTTKPDGMGLGLALCQSIVRAHRGRLGARPNSGLGMTFFFSLPSLASA